jgi:hypothetical protein
MNVCPNCGAPLPVAAPGEVEHCTFCGVEEREPVAAPPAPQPPPPPPRRVIPDAGPAPELAPARPSIGAGPLLVLGAIAIGIIGVAVAMETLTSPHPSAPVTVPPIPASPPMPTKPTATTPSVFTLANLGTLPSSAPAFVLDAPGMTGPLESFDVVANYDWITSIGAAWKPDAMLHRFEVRKVEKDGTVNIGKGATGYVVSYQSAAASCGCQLTVDLKAGDTPVVEVRRMAVSSIEPAIQKPACTLQKAFAALLKAGMPRASPSYTAAMLVNPHTVWVLSYFVSMSPARGGEGVVNAATCAVEHMT